MKTVKMLKGREKLRGRNVHTSEEQTEKSYRGIDRLRKRELYRHR